MCSVFWFLLHIFVALIMLMENFVVESMIWNYGWKYEMNVIKYRNKNQSDDLLEDNFILTISEKF